MGTHVRRTHHRHPQRRRKSARRSVDIALVTAAGAELAVPATKTYTAQLAALAVFGAALCDDAGELIAGLEAAAGEAQRMLADDRSAETVAAALVECRAMVVAGRGYTLSSALEIALKAQEVCGIAAVGLSGADLQHGPSALEGRETPLVIAAPPSGPCLPALHACATTAARRGARVYCIGGDERLRSLCDLSIAGPRLPEAIAPVVGAIPGQVLVEATAGRRGLDPDDPPGLTKVTQTAQ